MISHQEKKSRKTLIYTDRTHIFSQDKTRSSHYNSDKPGLSKYILSQVFINLIFEVKIIYLLCYNYIYFKTVKIIQYSFYNFIIASYRWSVAI